MAQSARLRAATDALGALRHPSSRLRSEALHARFSKCPIWTVAGDAGLATLNLHTPPEFVLGGEIS